MPRKKPSRALAATQPSRPAIPDRFAIGGTEIRPVQLARIHDRHPAGEGPWTGEPDRLAWIDPVTGLSCLILRQADGTLGGYVAVAPNHPLWGFNHDAIPANLNLHVHGGLDYGALCARRGPEDIRICHAHHAASRQSQLEGPGKDAGADDAWWFGFGCDKPGDLVPDGYKPALHREEGEVYRGIDYVYAETVELARQLKAIEDGAGGTDGPDGSGVPPQLEAPEVTEPRTSRRTRSGDES